MPSAIEQAQAAIHAGDGAALGHILAGADPGLVRIWFPFAAESADRRGNLLHWAASRGQLEAARHLVARGSPLDERSSEGLTALHYAFESGSHELAELLIEAGAEVDVCIAAGCGFHERLRSILRGDPSKVEDTTTGISPMTWAGFGRQTESMRILAQHGASDPSVLEERSELPRAEQVRLPELLFRAARVQDPLGGGQVRGFDGPPFGRCRISINPGRGTIANFNVAWFCGRPETLAADGPEQLTRLFLEQGVRRFSISLSPGPDQEKLRELLLAAGFHDRGAKQAVLHRNAEPPQEIPTTEFSVRELSRDEVLAREAELQGILWADAWQPFLATVGRPDFVHYAAFAGEQAVATGALQLCGELGYLFLGATAPAFRKRGAQQLLIARRIARAREHGCSVLASETEQVLVPSYRNLRRAGFELAYEKQVFSWNPVVA